MIVASALADDKPEKGPNPGGIHHAGYTKSALVVPTVHKTVHKSYTPGYTALDIHGGGYGQSYSPYGGGYSSIGGYGSPVVTGYTQRHVTPLGGLGHIGNVGGYGSYDGIGGGYGNGLVGGFGNGLIGGGYGGIGGGLHGIGGGIGGYHGINRIHHGSGIIGGLGRIGGYGGSIGGYSSGIGGYTSGIGGYSSGIGGYGNSIVHDIGYGNRGYDHGYVGDIHHSKSHGHVVDHGVGGGYKRVTVEKSGYSRPHVTVSKHYDD